MASKPKRTPAGTWTIRYRSPTGENVRETFKTYEAAKRRARAVEVDKDRGEWVDPRAGKLRVGKWLDKWHAGRLDLKPSTRARDEALLRNHVRPAFAKKTLSTVQPVDVRRFVERLHATGYSPGTVRKCYQLVSGSFEAAVNDGMIPRSPCRGIKLPKNEKPELRFLSTDEVAVLADAVAPRYRALVLTAAYTGLRAGELSGLHIDQLDLLRRRLHVTRAATEVRGHWSTGTPKTKASRRTVTLPKSLCDVLAAHVGKYGSESGLVFTATGGAPIRWSNFRRRVWLPALERVALGHVRFHDLRHTHAAWLVAANEHPKLIQSRLGHAAITTTLDTYGHLMDGLDEDAADRLDEAFQTARVPLSYHSPAAEIISLPSR